MSPAGCHGREYDGEMMEKKMELLRQTVPPAQMGSGDCSAFPPAQPPVSFHLWPVATSKHSVVDRKS